MFIRKIASALFITSLLYSCGSSEEEKDFSTSIRVDNSNVSDSVDISEYIDSIQIIPINETKGNYLGNIDKIYNLNDHYVAADIHQTHKINLFTKNGDFVKTLIKQGQGPDEVLQLNDCWINENGELEVYDYAMKKIFQFDSSYALKNIVKGEDFCIVNRIENIPNSSLYIGYAGFNGINPASVGEPFQVVILDKNLKIISRHMRYKSKYLRIMWLSFREHFYAYGDSLRFVKAYDNHVYSVTTSGLSKRYKIAYTDNALPADILEEVVSEHLEEFKDRNMNPNDRTRYFDAYTSLNGTWLENDQTAYFISKNGNSFMFASLFNKKNSKVESAKVFTARKKYQMDLPYFKTYDAKDKAFITLANGSWLKKALSPNSNFYKQTIDDPSIQYLVKVKLKI